MSGNGADNGSTLQDIAHHCGIPIRRVSSAEHLAKDLDKYPDTLVWLGLRRDSKGHILQAHAEIDKDLRALYEMRGGREL